MVSTMNGPNRNVRLRAQNITSSRSIDVDIDESLPAGQVAHSVAASFGLPDDVDWQLRLDESAAFLREELPIGEQLQTGSQVTLTPRVHLGAVPRGPQG